MKQTKTQLIEGQTLIELIVVLGVVALVLTGLIAAVTSSLRFGVSSRYRGLAVKHAQEGLELARKLRDSGTWSDFLVYSGGTSTKWCLPSNGMWESYTVDGCPLEISSQFWRTITFTWQDPIMVVTSEVSWGERVAPSIVSFTTYLTQWKN